NRFHPERVATTQPRVALAHLGTEQTLTFSTLKGLYNLPRFVCNPLRVEIVHPRSFPRVRWRDPGLCCSTPSGYFLAGRLTFQQNSVLAQVACRQRREVRNLPCHLRTQAGRVEEAAPLQQVEKALAVGSQMPRRLDRPVQRLRH